MSVNNKKPVGRPPKVLDKQNSMKAFSIINEISFTIPNSVENEEVINSEKFITWGDSRSTIHSLNPFFYEDMASNCPTLSAIISRRQDYLMGKNIIVNFEDEKKIKDIIYKLFKDIQTYGQCDLQVGWNGQYYEIEYIKTKNLRSNSDYSKFIYYDNWYEKKSSTLKMFNKFDNSKSREPQILHYKEPNDSHYGTPLYTAALTDCNTQIRIKDFNNNSVANNFNVSAFMTLPVANATDEEISILESTLISKYSGNKSAAKFFALTYDPNSPNGAKPELQRINADTGFNEQYNTIDKNTKESIYQTMKAIPALFGDVTSTTGFNDQEFIESYKQESTYINRLQNVLIDLFGNIYGEGFIEFIPFINIEEKVLDAELLMSILGNTNISDNQKKVLLKLAVKLSDEDIALFFPNVEPLNNSENELL